MHTPRTSPPRFRFRPRGQRRARDLALGAGLALALGCGDGDHSAPPVSSQPEASEERASERYDITVQVWRNEMPGGAPQLHVAARFALRAGAQPWKQVQLQDLELRADEQRWLPTEQTLESRPDGGFELRAQGEPTLAEGTEVALFAQLKTDSGSRAVEVGAGSVARAE